MNNYLHEKMKKYWKSDSEKPSYRITLINASSPANSQNGNGGMGMSMGGGMGGGMLYTGDGGNGRMETKNPVGMIQTMNGPRMIHEGEGMIERPDGSVLVVPQKKLKMIQADSGMKGYEAGGIYQEQDPEAGYVAPKSKQSSKAVTNGLTIVPDVNAADPEAAYDQMRANLNGRSGTTTTSTGTTGNTTSTPTLINPVVPTQAQALQSRNINVSGNRTVEAGTPSNVTTSVGSQAGYDRIFNIATGNDETANRIYNRSLSDLNRTTTGADRAATQRMAGVEGITPGAVAATTAEMGMNRSAQTSQLAGQLAIDANARADQAAQSLITLGATMDAAEQSRYTNALGRTASAVNTAYLEGGQAYRDGGWKNDVSTIDALKNEWENDPMHSGEPFDPNSSWAQSRINILTMPSDSAIIQSITSSSAYQNAPVTADGSLITADGILTRAFWDNVWIPFVSMAQVLGGDTGMVPRYNATTGNIDIFDAANPDSPIMSIDAKGNWVNSNPGEGTVFTNDSTGQTNLIKAMDESDLDFDNTSESSSQAWLSAGNTTMPKSITEWENFNTKTREYNSSDNGSMRDAADWISSTSNGSANPTPERVTQYFNENPDKKTLPSVQDFLTWEAQAGNPVTAASWAAGISKTITPQDIGYLASNAENWGKYTGPSGYSSKRTGPYKEYTIDADSLTGMQGLAGKNITVNGQEYYVNPSYPVGFGTIESAESWKSAGREGNTTFNGSLGVFAYNTKTKTWVIIGPDGKEWKPSSDSNFELPQTVLGSDKWNEVLSDLGINQ